MADPERCPRQSITNPAGNVFCFAGRDWPTGEVDVEDGGDILELMLEATCDTNAAIEEWLYYFDLDDWCLRKARRIEQHSLVAPCVLYDTGITAMTVTAVAAWLLHTYRAFSVGEAIKMCGLSDVPPACREALERIQTAEHASTHTALCEVELPSQLRTGARKRHAKKVPLRSDEHKEPSSPNSPAASA